MARQWFPLRLSDIRVCANDTVARRNSTTNANSTKKETRTSFICSFMEIADNNAL